MKQNIKILFIKYILDRQAGFTLIELLVVTIIVGVLSAIAIPSLLNQVGKAREAEAKNNLATLSRSQQIYHYEHKVFYNGANFSNALGVDLTQQNYAFQGDSTANNNKAIHRAYATNPITSGARDFSSGVYYNAPNYRITVCVASTVDNDGTSSSVTALPDASCSGGSAIQ